MPSLNERLATLEANSIRTADVVERLDAYLSDDRVKLEGRLSKVEQQLTVRTLVGGALVALGQLAHFAIPGLPGAPHQA